MKAWAEGVGENYLKARPLLNKLLTLNPNWPRTSLASQSLRALGDYDYDS